MTRAEYDEMFRKDENGCYVNLIVPPLDGYPEMNLIGKDPMDYTIEEIANSKAYRRVMRKRVEE